MMPIVDLAWIRQSHNVLIAFALPESGCVAVPGPASARISTGAWLRAEPLASSPARSRQ